MTPTVLIPLAEGFEELEAVTVIDILRRAGIKVVVAGLREGPVRAARGTVVHPDTSLAAVMDEDFDMITLPGGMPGVQHLREDPRVKALLERLSARGGYASAICAAPSILAAYGMLEGRRAAGNPRFKDQIALDGVRYVEDAVVQDGRLVTSRGPGTSVDFALTLVQLLAGEVTRADVENALVRR